MKLSARWLSGWSLFFLGVALPGRVHATGGWVPERFLDDGGRMVKAPPVFYWEIELTRLAKQYDTKDLPPKYQADPGTEWEEGGRAAATATADNADLEAALKEGKWKPSDPAAARAAQEEMRAWLQKGAGDQERPKLQEADSEFADYHKGAASLAEGKVAEARAAWEKLLKRPAGERHYRTVWAAFMLGKLCMKDAKTRAEALTWFGKCRQYAREGFADSLNLAADSIGWQARAEYDSGDHPAAARHYLQQLALGDTSAIRSLKLLVPDRESVVDLPPLSFSSLDGKGYPEGEAIPRRSDAEQKTALAVAEEEMTAAAKDEVLRQIVTTHILCTFSSYEGSPRNSRTTNWLDVIEKTRPGHVEGAASLGWAAYSAGRFAEAKKWALLDKPATPLGQWLQAKLALREGDFAGASRIMAAVVPQLPESEATVSEEDYLPRASAAADLGASLLAQGRIEESLAAFWNGGCWYDSAYVAERLLTADELLAFVKANAMLSDEERLHPPGRAEDHPERVDAVIVERWDRKNDLMNLAGRRLIREDRNAEGRPLLDPKARDLFDRFRQFGATGRDEQKPKMERARALFDAARILEAGVSWCGTQDDLVRAELGGYAPENPEAMVQSRRTGKPEPASSSEGNADQTPAPVFVPSSETERKRLSQIHATPKRQYVHQAAALAVQAAGLMPDNAEETADVLNQAGRWIQDLDNPGADKIYFQIEKRCPATRIGKAVIAKHWFIEPDGPWTNEPVKDGSTRQSLDELPH